MSRFTSSRVWPIATLALVAVCSDAGGPSNQAQVNFNVATRPTPTAAGSSLAVPGTPETFTDGTNTLTITAVQMALHQRKWELAVTLSDMARTIAVAHDSALLAAECAAIAARALSALGRRDQAAKRRAEAETGFRHLGAVWHLEYLEQA
jgi:hypothetical protein